MDHQPLFILFLKLCLILLSIYSVKKSHKLLQNFGFKKYFHSLPKTFVAKSILPVDVDFNVNYQTLSLSDSSFFSEMHKNFKIENELYLKLFNGYFLHGVDIRFDFDKETIGDQIRRLGSTLIEFNDELIDKKKVIRISLAYFVAISEIGLKPTFRDLKLEKDENERYESEALQSIRKGYGINYPYIDKVWQELFKDNESAESRFLANFASTQFYLKIIEHEKKNGITFKSCLARNFLSIDHPKFEAITKEADKKK